MLASSLVATLLCAAEPPVQSNPIAIRVDAIVQPDGSLGAGGWIVLRNHRIDSIGATPPAPGATLLEPGGVASAGLIDPVTGLGSDYPIIEPIRSFTPEATAADAFDAGHSSFLAAARGGITTVGLSPSSDNVVGGRVAIVRTQGGEGAATLTGSGPLRFALSDEAFVTNRKPTSRMAALPMLREWLASGAAKGSGPSVVDAGTADEIRLALELFGAAGQPLALLRPRQADDALELVKAAAPIAILGPLDIDSSPRERRLPSLLHGAGVPVAFTADGGAGALRVTAAVAVRDGLDAKAARLALTRVPARVLGVESDSGTLEVGKRADVVVWSGDVLDLSSKVKLVVADGAVVAAKKEAP